MFNKRQLFALLPIAALLAITSGTYWQTVAQLLGVGQLQEKATDAPLVILVALVLIWNARQRLSQTPLHPCFWGQLPLLGAGFVWLCGELTYARVFTQLAVIATLPAAVLAVCGKPWLRILTFPFSILLFALPVWVVIVPTLVKMSAFIAELAIKASGVPIYRDGAYFILPSGSWSIADACSGVAFFSTSLLLGLIYAWTIFESTRKRILFIAGAAAIGIAGNWIRVYLTMMVAHLSDNRYLRDDHYMFGWYLFAVFLFSYFYFGWRYRDASTGNSEAASGTSIAAPGGTMAFMIASPYKLTVAVVLCIMAIAIWPFLHGKLSANVDGSAPRIGTISSAKGWAAVAREQSDWKPDLKNASFDRSHTFENEGRKVTVYFGVYESEDWDRKLVSVANQLAGRDGSNWSLADRDRVQVKVGDSDFNAKSGVIVGKGVRLLAWQWYWVDGKQTSNDLAAKLKQLQSRLRGREPLSVWVTVSTQADQGNDDAGQVLGKFLNDMSPSFLKALVSGSDDFVRIDK